MADVGSFTKYTLRRFDNHQQKLKIPLAIGRVPSLLDMCSYRLTLKLASEGYQALMVAFNPLSSLPSRP